MANYIKGKFKRTIFESNNGYVIGLVRVKETNDSIMKDYVGKIMTFTGYFADLNLDDDYIFYGKIIEHPKYGIQYNVDKYDRIKPEDIDGIVAFLSSDLFPSIGEKLATRIVDTLGENTLDKILEDKENLKKVPKINNKKIDIIYNVLMEYEESHKIVVYLTELGFNMKDALSIYNKYKKETIMVIENNIYDLIDEVDNILFRKVDEISRKLHYEYDDIRRIKACIIYIMKDISFINGDTYLEYDEIKKYTIDYLKFNIMDDDFKNLLDELRYEGKIVLEQNLYYIKQTYNDETYIADKIKRLLNKELDHYDNFKETLGELEGLFNINYNTKQEIAIEKALTNNILIINGGPGTGKTTIIKAITTMYQTLNDLSYDALCEEVKLLAPTGRASKRMSEATNMPASTIHRFLRWDKESNSFNINEYDKDYSKLIIVDEVSMIDLNLFASLLRGLTNDIKIILVGDYNQLPSVGAGNVLKDLIESDIIDVIELDTLYRQSEESYINTLALEIKENELTDFTKSKDDYKFIECSNYEINENIKNICSQIIKNGYDYRDVQVMAPMYIGLNGIDRLNKELQNIFNPKSENKKEIVSGDVIFREKDKVLQLENMPDENVFNGDIGYIEYIVPANVSDSKKNEIYVNYDGIVVKYLPQDLVKIKHAFIISIHKAQGSEFKTVILPITMNYKRMLYRKLIYTAITRAKKELIIVGEAEAFKYSVLNNYERIRKTNLKNRLINMYNT